MSGQPILVAGKTGQLARCLAEEAGRRGSALVALGRPELDLGKPELVARVVAAHAPRAIVNAAAYTAVDKAESEPELAMAVNRDGAGALAAAAAGRGVPFLHISTDYVFDGRKDAPYREEDAPCPLGAYGRSKLEGEAAVRGACPAGVILRTSWVYSPFGQNFLTTMLGLAATRDMVPVVDDQHGAPTAAPDLAAAILDLAERLTTRRMDDAGGVYHLTGAGETTWHGFAGAIFAGWGRRGHRVPGLAPITTAQYPTAAQRPANSRLDCSKSARVFGLRLPPWQHSLERCLDELASAPVEAQA
ncbi:MAG: dTDP-4-dehydrorhamnose reductase [Hyphomicrobiales bacterium]|nr:dTDP-4-dehydrorhamnose reductase [Hyphomicrobiales bacterium]MBV8826203.1 dTDP-4-dehydrorhamnose reductase [Hyphomicrobiales bacterium]MBV9427631.1 dTDP-4-dehydrorhamnose reductase [Bradyrhizobiaceae bacterium]